MSENITKWIQTTNEWSNPANTSNLSKTVEVGGFYQYKEFGLFDFTPTEDYYTPLVSASFMKSTDGIAYVGNNYFATQSVVTSLDLSLMNSTTIDKLHLVGMWYLEDDIAIDSVRVWATSSATSAETIGVELYSYAYDESTGDLSDGTQHFTTTSFTGQVLEPVVGAPATTDLYKGTEVFPKGRVIYVFTENADGTEKISVKCVVKYRVVTYVSTSTYL